MDDIIGYKHCNLGINNQKFALLGLLSVAKNKGIKKITLPKLVSFDPTGVNTSSYDFYDFYDSKKLKKFFYICGIDIIDEYQCENEDAFGCFMAGTSAVGSSGSYGLSSIYSDACQFFSHLYPIIINDVEFSFVKKEIFGTLGVKTALQLRIENDWVEYSKKNLTESDEKHLVVENIFKKISQNHDLIKRPIYVVCDEKNLPISKEDIKTIAKNQYGINIFFKSDFFSACELQKNSNLYLSILDFEIAISSANFIGTSRSTFSNLISFEKFCRYRKNVTSDFIYNSSEKGLSLRRDNGVQCDPSSVVSTPLQRSPLLEVKPYDCRWQARILGHISQYGDMESFMSPIEGLLGGNLVIGDASNPDRKIEGLSIEIKSVENISIEYKIYYEDSQWSDWFQNGDFAGSRGIYKPIKGISIRLKGENSKKYDCIYAVKFNNDDIVYSGSNAEECLAHGSGHIICIHVLFRPSIIEWD